MKLFHLIIIVICLQFLNCSSAKKAIKPQNSQECQSVIGGFLHSNISFNGKGPALLLHDKPWKKKVLFGSIAKIDSEGIWFEPKEDYCAFCPKVRLYPYSEIACVIDSANTIIYGGLPNKNTNIWGMYFEIIREAVPNDELVGIFLEANKSFSYCLSPGIYTVKNIRFFSNRTYQDEVTLLPKIIIQVDQDKYNYLGDIFLDYQTEDTSDLCIFESKILPSSSRAFGPGLAWMIMGIAKDAIIDETTTADYDYRETWEVDNPIHSFKIKIDSSFSIDTKLPISISPLRFEKNEHSN